MNSPQPDIDPETVAKLTSRLGQYGAKLDQSEFSWQDSVGGWRGILESIGPTLVFLVAFLAGLEVWMAAAVALGFAVVLIIIRLVRRQSLSQAIAGSLMVIIGALWAWKSGKGENFFIMGIITNAVYLGVFLVSLVVRWPLIGLVVGWFRQQGVAWRRDPQLRSDRKAYYAVTLLWIVMFALRLVVKVPLYLAGNVPVLGTLHLVMGVPLFALITYLSWLFLRRTHGDFFTRIPGESPGNSALSASSDTGSAVVRDSDTSQDIA